MEGGTRGRGVVPPNTGSPDMSPLGLRVGTEWGNNRLPPSLKGRTVRTHVPHLRFSASAVPRTTRGAWEPEARREPRRRERLSTRCWKETRGDSETTPRDTHNTHNTLSHCGRTSHTVTLWGRTSHIHMAHHRPREERRPRDTTHCTIRFTSASEGCRYYTQRVALISFRRRSGGHHTQTLRHSSKAYDFKIPDVSAKA